MKIQNSIEYHLVDIQWIEKLVLFFQDIAMNSNSSHFHPHPLTQEKAKEIAEYSGKDLYFLQSKRNEIIGYGMLRGWDEGYSIPSLGIVIHPNYRRLGYAKQFMKFLQMESKKRGVKKIMLKVYEDNVDAFRLYCDLGYCFTKNEKGHKIGYLEL